MLMSTEYTPNSPDLDRILHLSAAMQTKEASEPASVSAIMNQMTQALIVFSDIADVMATATGVTRPQHAQLQVSARMAEAAMHQLRRRHLTRIPAATDLSQCLTVMVLVADMLAAGQLTDDVAEYDLLQRNARRALEYLRDLRQQLALEL